MSFCMGRARFGARVRKILWACLLWCCAAAIVGVRAQGQTSVDGAVSGFVIDASGAALVGAVVQVQNLATGLATNAVTEARGEFVVAHLSAGEYRVIVDYERFANLTLDPVVVEVGGMTSVEARLKIGGVASSVSVTATPNPPATVSIDEVASTATASVITQDEIDLIPVNGRRWQTFALLTPTANADPESDGLLSFRGVASTQNSSRIDGGDDDQSYGAVPRGTGAENASEIEDAAETGSYGRVSAGSVDGGGGYGRHAGAAYTFSQEAVREFRVSGQNYSALYGHAAGGIITTVSKSGTNKIHGTGFYLVRSSALGATNPFSIETNYVDGVTTSEAVKPHDLRQQFGGSVGGPAIKDKLFYFYAYDQQRRSFPAISTPADPNFYALTPTQTALLGNRGVTATKVNAALNYLDSLTGTVPRRQDQTINFGKMDWQAAERHRVSVQYDRARSSAPSGVRTSPVVDLGTASMGSSYVRVDSLLGRWMWRASPKLSHELRIQYGRDLQFEQAPPPLPQEPAVSVGGFAPEIAIGPDGFTFGTSTSLGRTAYPDENKIQFADLLTWVHGRHQLQLGADLSLVHDNIVGLSNIQGAFHYDSGTTSGHAGGLVDWITDYTFNVNAYPNGGCPSITAAVHDFCFRSFTQSFGQQSVTFNTQEWAGFLQDDWRVRQGLTVNVGLRYEYELSPLPQQPNLTLDEAFGQTGATSVFPEDRNNFGPRAGVSWEPFGSGKGVVRIGYGLFYGRLPGATIRSALINTALPSSSTSVLILPTTVTNCPQVANQGFGYACAYVTTPPAAVAKTTSAMVFDRRFRLPAVQQGSFTLEREIAGGTVASATYLLNLDRQLPNSVDINIAPSTTNKLFQLQGGTGTVGVRDGETFVVPFYGQRINSNFGPVTDIVSNANATYNALTLEARRRSRGGLEFRASWTWAKAIDFGQNGATPRTNAQFDPFNVRYDKGLSALNFPHKVVASAVWAPAFPMEQHWLRTVANGWSVAPIFTETSGKPYSLDIFGGTRLAGGHETINGSGGAVYLPTVGRNTLRLPDTGRVDLRLARAVWASERVKLRGVVEVFNLTNRVNYSAIMQRAYLAGTETDGVTPLVFQNAATVAAEGLNVQPFGTFTAASTGQSPERQVQLGLRVEF
ncbi:TonB-dependent receptor [Tunturiibacter lichenicola]|uniref:TonB-dependent receptor n=1 Tax=Tunturiibacter lichenicola TaxID=2051959 RepID=UPI0021B461FF|nr:TonB-dependent receptor [Edaphobacter lichenicola]